MRLPPLPNAGHTPVMPDYRRNRVPGGTFFFTVNLLDRRSDLLVIQTDACGMRLGGSAPAPGSTTQYSKPVSCNLLSILCLEHDVGNSEAAFRKAGSSSG